MRGLDSMGASRRGGGAKAPAWRSAGRLGAAGAAVLALVALAVSPAFADHGLGHNGETLTVSKDADIADGETVTVELESWLPGATITVVTCYNFPSAGPADCELSNYGQHTIIAADDGTATLEYPVSVVPGRCDHENQCYIVAGDGIGPNANYAGALVSFAVVEEAAAEEETMAEEEAAPEPTAAPAPETTAAPEPEPEPTAAPAPETTAAPEPEPEPTAAPAPAPSDGDNGGGGSAGLIVVIVVVAVAVVGGGVVMVRRRSA